MSVQIIQGDCREVLKTLPAESVDCIVTSPPYYGLRDYGVAGQIGLEATPDAYVKELVGVFAECRRVLKNSGTLFLNLGDSYFGGGGGGGSKGSKQQTNAGSLIPGHTRGGARHEAAYGKTDKAPEGSPASDCFCQSLCDACREAYRIGKSHNGFRHASTPLASSSVSILAHRELPSDHLPTSGLVRQGDHSSNATLGFELAPNHEDERPPSALVSTKPESALQLSGMHSAASSQAGECLLCGHSLRDCAPAFAHRAACICGTSDGVLDDRKIGKGASGSAYPDYTTASLKPKDLIGVPWLVAFALRADGWYLRSDIIWSKPNPMPESVTDRPTKAHEYLFLLSKAPRYFFDADAVRLEPTGRTDPIRNFGHVPNNNHAPSYDLDALKGRNIRSVWSIATQPFSEAHFATFPPDLIEPCIKAGCPEGGTVLDPFGGAGTTALVADRLQRNSIIIELNPDYAAMSERRLNGDAGMFASVERQPSLLDEAAA